MKLHCAENPIGEIPCAEDFTEVPVVPWSTTRFVQGWFGAITALFLAPLVGQKSVSGMFDIRCLKPLTKAAIES